MTEKKNIKNIMVIDDDVQLVDAVRTLLESAGYEVSHAYQAEKGMELARDIKPDLILLDVMFAAPRGPDGIEISRRLHQDNELAGIPVIILSGIRKVLDFPYRVGPDETWMPVKAFLEKPIKPNELLTEVAKALVPEN